MTLARRGIALVGALSIGSLVVAAAPARGEVDLAAGVTTEAGGGESPLVPGRDPERSVTGVLQPAGVVRFGPRDGRISIRYSPRLAWQRPNPTERDVRPLVLHVLDVGALVLPAPTTTFELVSNLSVGEPDYATLQAVLGTAQGALPLVPNLLITSHTGTLSLAPSSRAVTGVRVGANHRRTLGDDPANTEPVGTLALSNQTEISAGPFFTYRITPLDRIDLAADVSYEWRNNPEITFFVAFASVGWQRQFTRNTALTVAGGAAYSRFREPSPGEDGRRPLVTDVSPLGTLEYEGVWWRSGGNNLTTNLTLTVETVVDPVLPTAGPRGSTGAVMALTVGRSRTALEAGFGTSLRDQPLDPPMPGPGMTMPPPLDETMFSVALSHSRRLSPTFTLATRLRWSDRAPHFDDPAFKFHQREIWLSVGATYGTRTLDRP